jgi:hypothetical protein
VTGPADPPVGPVLDRVVTSGGLVACVDPGTGAVRAEETVRSQEGRFAVLLAADGGQVTAAVGTACYSGIVTIGAPRICWKGS